MKLQLVTEQEKAHRLERKLEQVEVSLLCCLGNEMNIQSTIKTTEVN